jgi:hypothetical protein
MWLNQVEKHQRQDVPVRQLDWWRNVSRVCVEPENYRSGGITVGVHNDQVGGYYSWDSFYDVRFDFYTVKSRVHKNPKNLFVHVKMDDDKVQQYCSVRELTFALEWGMDTIFKFFSTDRRGRGNNLEIDENRFEDAFKHSLVCLPTFLIVYNTKNLGYLQMMLKDPMMCPMCHSSLKHHVRGRWIPHEDGRCYSDIQVPLGMRTSFESRKCVWTRKHDGEPRGIYHDMWLWNHCHYFEYDLSKPVNRIYNRIEFEILIECRRLRFKVSRKGEMRMKSVYRFPGPPKKIKPLVSDEIWEILVSHLIMVVSGYVGKLSQFEVINMFGSHGDDDFDGFFYDFEWFLLHNIIVMGVPLHAYSGSIPWKTHFSYGYSKFLNVVDLYPSTPSLPS